MLDDFKKQMKDAAREAGANGWSEPIPFNDYSGLLEFPANYLPEPSREMVRVVSEVNQVDLGMPGSCYLSGLSIASNKKYVVDLRTHSEQPSIYTVCIAESGLRKTPTLNSMSAPIYDFEAMLIEEMSDVIHESRSLHSVREKRLGQLQNTAAKTDNLTERQKLIDEAAELSKEIAKDPPLNAPTFISDDITPEALGTLMADNSERMGIISAEGGIFSIWSGLYSTDKHVNFDVALKGYSGDSWKCGRIGRESRLMRKPALSMCLCVQPDVIRSIGDNRRFRGKGLSARILYSMSSPRVGWRKRQMNCIPSSIEKKYRDHIFSIMQMKLPEEPPKIALTEAGQELWNDFYNKVEFSLRRTEELGSLQDWGSKLPGNVARISGLLHVAQHGVYGLNEYISRETVVAACAIGEYYRSHALAAFDMMKEVPEFEFAQIILDYIQSRRISVFKGREILTNKNRFKTMTEVDMGLEVLIERGYIRESIPSREKKKREAGGKIL